MTGHRDERARQRLLLFAAASEVILAKQAAALLKTSTDSAAERLEVLRTQRLVSRVRLSGRLPDGYRITPEGAELIDSQLPATRPLSPAAYRHEIGVGWLWVAAQHGNLGVLREVLTRREMHAADQTLRSESLLNSAGATFADQPVADQRPGLSGTYPDLALIQHAGGWVTVNLILGSPSAPQLEWMIGRSGRQQPLILAQLFMVQHPEIGEQIKHAAVTLGLGDRVHVQRLAQNGIDGA